MNRYIIGLGVFLLLMILIIVVFFRGGPDTKKATPRPLTDYAFDSSSEVSFTSRGQINGDDIHRTIRIIVARDYRRIDIIQGYEGNVVKSQEFANNSEAYREFLYAINYAGFIQKNSKIVGEKLSQVGRCPLGNLYIYEHNLGTEELAESWSATCKDIGNFTGNVPRIKTLFQAQITNYSQITSGVTL